jgi:hypothetical protein
MLPHFSLRNTTYSEEVITTFTYRVEILDERGLLYHTKTGRDIYDVVNQLRNMITLAGRVVAIVEINPSATK